MITFNPISFCGKLSRQTEWRHRFNEQTGRREFYEHVYSKDEFIKTYDKAIEEIKERKQFALKVDDLMQNDPDIQQAIKELPDTTTVEYCANQWGGEGTERESIHFLAEGIKKGESEEDRDLLDSDLCLDYKTYDDPDKEKIMKFLEDVKSEVENN